MLRDYQHWISNVDTTGHMARITQHKMKIEGPPPLQKEKEEGIQDGDSKTLN